MSRWALAVFMISGCATRSIPTAIDATNTYLLAVKTGNPASDRVLYNVCASELQQTLTIVENGNYTGVIEISFQTPYATADSLGWYSRYRQYGYEAERFMTTFPRVEWENAAMLIVVKNGQRVVSSNRWKYRGKSATTAQVALQLARYAARTITEDLAK